VAVRLAEQIFGALKDTSVLIIGSGEMAELALLHLCTHGCKKMTVANRTVERAAELAERFGGAAISLSDVGSVLDDVDIVIGSIRIDHAILTRKALEARNRGKPLFLIDLGLPRNFAPDLSELDSVYLYNIDDLAHIADENKALRQAAAREAEVIVDYGLLQFERWRARIAANPEIVDLRGRVHAICSEEVSRIVSSVSGSVPADLSKQLAYAIGQKIAHELTELLEREKGVPGKEHDEHRSPFLIVTEGKD
jgi:glutamyl-tRNA reductase